MEGIVNELGKINNTLEKILNTLNRPENKVMIVLKTAGAFASALGILSIAEIIRKWIIGG